jgi:hypothetical protein
MSHIDENSSAKRTPLSQVNSARTPFSDPIYGTHNASGLSSLKSPTKVELPNKKITIPSFDQSEESEFVKTLKKALGEAIEENTQVWVQNLNNEILAEDESS